ncbi:PRA1 domain-containing protein [Cephalotus follicularis]|uniref:PRA1 family protein n=1 Tax=Cephalotus follicularis TaxID=3775 RepID=A0A1Q3BNK0_CEPFO|nr:PRA1 domain-containing protein [Cephalotus follicularis]
MSSSSQFIDRLKETAQSITTIRRPWRDFLDLTALNVPASLSDATTRVTQNLAHYRFNYATLLLLIIFISLLYHPISLIAFLVTLLAWFFFYFSREDDPLTIFGVCIDDRIVGIALFAVTVGVLVWTGVWVNVVVSVLVGGFLVILHSGLRTTDDLVMDDLESPYGPMLDDMYDVSPDGAYSSI